MRNGTARGRWGGSRWRGIAPVAVVVLVLAVTAVLVATEFRSSRAPATRPVIISSGVWAPFVGPDLRGGGPLAELVTEVLRSEGYAPEVSFTSWSLAEQRAVSGQTFGVFPLVSSPDRREDLLLSDALVDFRYVLFHDLRRGTPQVRTAEDLADLRVGRIAGYQYWPELHAAVSGYVEYPTSLAGFRALAAGEIDLLPEGLLSGEAVLASPDFAADASHFGHLEGDDPLLQSTEGLHFMMSRSTENAALMRAFDAGLDRLRSTDAYTRIVGDLTTDAGAAVTLTPATGSGLVELLRADGTLALFAPLGTRAHVLEWPAEFVTSAELIAGPVLVPVKILDGPAQGRVFHVDARTLQLEVPG